MKDDGELNLMEGEGSVVVDNPGENRENLENRIGPRDKRSKIKKLVSIMGKYSKIGLILGTVGLMGYVGYGLYKRHNSGAENLDMRTKVEKAEIEPYFFEGKIRAYIDENDDSIPDNGNIKMFYVLYNEKNGVNEMVVKGDDNIAYNLFDSRNKIDVNLTEEDKSRYDGIRLEEIIVQDKERTQNYTREDLMDVSSKGDQVRETFKRLTHTYKGIMKALSEYEINKKQCSLEDETDAINKKLEGYDLRDKYKVDGEDSDF